MRLTLALENLKELISLEVSTSMTLADFKAYIECETGIPVDEMIIFFQLNPLVGDDKILNEWGFQGDELIIVERRQKKKPVADPAPPSPPPPPENPFEAEIERLRLQISLDDDLKQRLLGAYPDLTPVINDPIKFKDKMLAIDKERRQQDRAIKDELLKLSTNPDDEDNQKRILEIIRQEQIAENLENALEHNPEAFGRVTMLYINVEVNGFAVKAFVDSGAQATIISPECADKCGILRLLDQRFKGVAKGVGTANILGRIHSAPIKVGTSFLPCSFTVIEGQSVDLLLGLDMLKRHQGIIDLKNNILVLGESQTSFLPESELPKDAFEEQGSTASTSDEPAKAEKPKEEKSKEEKPKEDKKKEEKPKEEKAKTAPQMPDFPEDKIKMLTNLGFSRDQALVALQLTDGNADLAASLLFQ